MGAFARPNELTARIKVKGGVFLMAVTDVLTQASVVLNTVFSMFTNVISTITGNPLLYVPVLFSLLGAIIFFAIGVVRKLGVRGSSASGRRRKRFGR